MARWRPAVQVKIYRGARYQQEDAVIWRRHGLEAVFSTCHHQLWGPGKGVRRWGVLVAGRPEGPWHCGRVGGGVVHLEARWPLGPAEISVWGSCTSKAPHMLNRWVFWLSTIRNTLATFHGLPNYLNLISLPLPRNPDSSSKTYNRNYNINNSKTLHSNYNSNAM